MQSKSATVYNIEHLEYAFQPEPRRKGSMVRGPVKVWLQKSQTF